jgi:two-component system LytT family response regulator
MITAVIVDDEPLARKRIRSLLDEHVDFDVLAEAESGEEALTVFSEHQPDVVFLDVQMNGMTGFDVADSLDMEKPPLVIFVTAYEEFALRAFQVNAVSYLLKPVERQSFSKALERVRHLLTSPDGAREDLHALLTQLRRERMPLQRIVVKARGRTILLRPDEIDWIESAGNYVRLHAGKDRYLLRETMGSIEEKLDATRFLRVHRTAIVNVDRIRELHPTSHGDYDVVLNDGTLVTLSRLYRDRVEPILGKL